MTSQHTTRCFFGCNAGSGFHTFFNFYPGLKEHVLLLSKVDQGRENLRSSVPLERLLLNRVMIWSISIAPLTLSRMTPLSFRH